jgi:hypothetical protein
VLVLAPALVLLMLPLQLRAYSAPWNVHDGLCKHHHHHHHHCGFVWVKDEEQF